jgi:hypothetical protein
VSGFGGELRALLFQFGAQLAKILDDAVMHHGDTLGRVRMCIGLVRLAMGRPAGVADAGVTLRAARCAATPGFSACLRRAAARDDRPRASRCRRNRNPDIPAA